MPQSLANVLIHVVFSTKNRQPFLKTKEVRDVMTKYLVGTLHHIKCPSLIVAAVEDHVHALCNLHRTMSVSKLIEELKTSSSHRIKEEGPALAEFHWQNGYGAFSVSQSNAEQVKAYIENQEEHHKKISAFPGLRQAAPGSPWAFESPPVGRHVIGTYLISAFVQAQSRNAYQPKHMIWHVASAHRPAKPRPNGPKLECPGRCLD
jgi:putative transposase